MAETGTSNDITRSAFNLFVWAQIELQAGIICASAPSLRVFFRRYLGASGFGSRKTRDTNGTTTARSKQITVKRDTSVTYEQDLTESTESLTTPIDKMPTITKPTWSPITGDNRVGATIAATRYSHEEDSYGLNDLSWKKAEKEQNWEDRV
jgi:hypothetical protein